MKKFLQRVRSWAIHKLDAVDRQACIDFAEEGLVAAHGKTLKSYVMHTGATLQHGAVIIGDFTCIQNCNVFGTVRIAPWCRESVIRDCMFLDLI